MMNDEWWIVNEDPIKKLQIFKGWCFLIMIAILDIIVAHHNFDDDISFILAPA